jgi:hypothetical protein
MKSNIEVLLDVAVFQKLKHWVEMATGEVSGLGTVSEVKDKAGNVVQYIIDNIFLLKQRCSSADTVLDDASVGEFLYQMQQKGEDLSCIKLWWHSHGDLNTFWSTTDEENIQRLSNSSSMISLVTNHAGKILTRIDIFKPFHVTVDEVRTDIHLAEEEGLHEFCAKEFVEKVEEAHTFAPMIPSNIPFPGRSPIDDQADELESMFNTGRITMEEYEQRLMGLDILQTEEYCS